MTIKDAFQFGIEPVRITDTDNIQINEGLPTNADPQVYAFELAKLVKTMLNGVLKSAQENIPFPVEVLPTRNSLPTPIIAHTLADRSVVVPVRGGKRPEVVTVPSGQEIVVEPIEQAILISEQTKLWDAKSSTGFTQGTLQQDAMNRPGFPGECFICELRLPDHRFRWKHNKLFLLLPEEYGPAFPAIVDCYTSPPT